MCVPQSGEDDVSQFDSKFTKQTPVDSPDDHMLSESANMVFEVGREFMSIIISITFIIVIIIVIFPWPSCVVVRLG